MNNCFQCSFTGPYIHSAEANYGMGVIWHEDLGGYESLEFAEMRLCR